MVHCGSELFPAGFANLRVGVFLQMNLRVFFGGYNDQVLIRIVALPFILMVDQLEST